MKRVMFLGKNGVEDGGSKKKDGGKNGKDGDMRKVWKGNISSGKEYEWKGNLYKVRGCM